MLDDEVRAKLAQRVNDNVTVGTRRRHAQSTEGTWARSRLSANSTSAGDDPASIDPRVALDGRRRFVKYRAVSVSVFSRGLAWRRRRRDPAEVFTPKSVVT